MCGEFSSSSGGAPLEEHFYWLDALDRPNLALAKKLRTTFCLNGPV